MKKLVNSLEATNKKTLQRISKKQFLAILAETKGDTEIKEHLGLHIRAIEPKATICRTLDDLFGSSEWRNDPKKYGLRIDVEYDENNKPIKEWLTQEEIDPPSYLQRASKASMIADKIRNMV